MQMELVRVELRRALAAVKQISGGYLQPEEIATLHLYLAAVSQATGQSAQARCTPRPRCVLSPSCVPTPTCSRRRSAPRSRAPAGPGARSM